MRIGAPGLPVMQAGTRPCGLRPGITILALKQAARTIHAMTPVASSFISDGLPVVTCYRAPARTRETKGRPCGAAADMAAVLLPRAFAVTAPVRGFSPAEKQH